MHGTKIRGRCIRSTGISSPPPTPLPRNTTPKATPDASPRCPPRRHPQRHPHLHRKLYTKVGTTNYVRYLPCHKKMSPCGSRPEMILNLAEALSKNLTYIDPMRTGTLMGIRGTAITQSGHLVAVSEDENQYFYYTFES